MYCKRCGTVLPNGAVFCTKCGAKQDTEINYLPGAAPSNGSVGFFRAIGLYFKNYVNFTGRASRSEFWWAFLFTLPIELFAWAVREEHPALFLLLRCPLILPDLSLEIRRLHDIGKPWYWQLLGLVPFVGTVIKLVFYAKESDGDNPWGPADEW